MIPTEIPLAPLLHALAQALLYPVLALLLLAVLFLAYQVGVFVGEWWSFRRVHRALEGEDPSGGALAERVRSAAEQLRGPGEPAARAERWLAAEELRIARRVERTDLLVRLGPALGLAGTLIPLGPGLAALGRGEVALLAGSLTVAFDTTIVGLLVGAVAFVLSSIRRRWYEAYLLWAGAHLEDRIQGKARGEPVAAVAP